MARRLCLGTRTSDTGLFISKPGIDVMTATDHDMLFSTGFKAFQFVMSGRVSMPSITLTIPNLGYNPMVMVFARVTGFAADFLAETYVIYNSFTSVTVYCNPTIANDGTMTYVVMRVPVG